MTKLTVLKILIRTTNIRKKKTREMMKIMIKQTRKKEMKTRTMFKCTAPKDWQRCQ